MNRTTFINSLSKEVYGSTFQFRGNDSRHADSNIDETHERVAWDLAQCEDESIREVIYQQFLTIMTGFAASPGGRILSNAGTGLKGTTYINCFVDGFIGYNQDSLEGILSTLRRQALILKSEGGYGMNSDVLRPRGAYIEGIANESPGSVDMLDMWDTQSTVITKGSGRESKKGKIKIRKGAQMVTKSTWHPDIEEFIIAKQTPNRLTKFNMSVLCDDDFMRAVENHLPWNLKFPDYENCPTIDNPNVGKWHDNRGEEAGAGYDNRRMLKGKEVYDALWDGNIYLWELRGLPVKIYKTYEDANELWDLIMKSTYFRNEPGILFVTIINKFNNLWYYEYINATNPCGEQLLPIGAVCLLGSMNLTQFINDDDGTFDWQKFNAYIPVMVRMMDNVNDRTNVPLKSQEQNLQSKRRIGLGIFGYGSALMMMKKRYGSDEAIAFTEILMKVLANEAYRASAYLAKEKGAFPLFDKEKYLQSKFIQSIIEPDVQDLIHQYGIRNSHLLSIQPTGNTGVLANNVTGGGEPVFAHETIRTSMQAFAPDGLDVPQRVDFDNKTFHLLNFKSSNLWKWVKEGDENLLRTEFEGEIWKFDKNRGLLKESLVEDYGVWWLKQRGEWDPKAEWAAQAHELSVDDHIVTMEVLARHLDSAMSKTVNLPEDYPYDDFKKLYLDCWKTGVIKGCTSYREGTMTSVLSRADIEEKSSFEYHTAPERPRELPCDIHSIMAKGKKWVVLVGLFDNKPYEAFCLPADSFSFVELEEKGFLIKEKKGYSFKTADQVFKIPDISAHSSDEEQAFTRMISAALRHGSSIDFIIEQLEKSHGSVVSFSKAIARALRVYATKLKEQESKIERLCNDETQQCQVVHEDGCIKCMQCGYSVCK